MLNVPSFADMTSSGATIRQVLNGGQMYLGPQIDALGPDTRLVTLTAGGNDVSYVGDLVFLAYRNRKNIVGHLLRYFWKGPKSDEARDFPTLRADFDATLSEIRRRSPRARIIVATYPQILPDGAACIQLGLTDAQIMQMRPVGERLAEITRTAALAGGAIIVDMSKLSGGHDVCSPTPWVNGPFPEKGAGAAFHPTLSGAKATAEAIFHQIRDDKIG
jgi:hypothetical protein